MNAAFPDDVFNTLKTMRELEFRVPIGTVDDSMTQEIKNTFPQEIMGGRTFGLQELSDNFKTFLREQYAIENPGPEFAAAALAYTHIKQIAMALAECNSEQECVKSAMDSSQSNQSVGFRNFNDRIAVFDIQIREY